MKHEWPDELVDIGTIDSGEIGLEAPIPYWVTVAATNCARCGRTRRQARGVPCSEGSGDQTATKLPPEAGL